MAKGASGRRGVRARLPRVLVADSRPLVADALAVALGSSPGLAIMPDRPTSARGAIEAAALARPDLALLDYSMEMEGPVTTRLLRNRVPGTKVILVCWFPSPREILLSLAAGAVGVTLRTDYIWEVHETIERALGGESPINPKRLRSLAGDLGQRDLKAEAAWERIVTLTMKEISLLRMLAMGARPEAVARELVVSISTVRKHVKTILRKLGAHSQREAVALAQTYGLVVV